MARTMLPKCFVEIQCNQNKAFEKPRTRRQTKLWMTRNTGLYSTFLFWALFFREPEKNRPETSGSGQVRFCLNRFRFSLTWQLQVRSDLNIFKLFLHSTWLHWFCFLYLGRWCWQQHLFWFEFFLLYKCHANVTF